MGGLRRGHCVRQRSGSCPGSRPSRRRARRGSHEPPGLVSREPDELRLAVPRQPHDRFLWGQGDRHQPCAPDGRRRPLHRRALGGEVPEDAHLPAGRRGGFGGDRPGRRRDLGGRAAPRPRPERPGTPGSRRAGGDRGGAERAPCAGVSATLAAVRVEHDLLGEYPIPVDALYGVHTARALENFPPLGPRLADVVELCSAFGMVKLAATRANLSCGQLDREVAQPITAACEELIDCSPELRSNLLVPLLQGGAGTSTNMNVNEVLANRALELLGCTPGDYARCHPNDHVNRSQSTNDVYPTALRVALLLRNRRLGERLSLLVDALADAGERFAQIPKLARTQLRDAVPMTVGNEFAAWRDGCQSALDTIHRGASALLAVNLGGTAVGTGLTAPRDFAELAVAHLSAVSGLAVRRAASAI